MKKFLLTLSVFIIATNTLFAVENKTVPTKNPDKITNTKFHRENTFEKRLGLTEEQKVKAREIRIKGHEKLKPIIEEIKAKKQEAQMVKMSRIAVQVQEERLTKIDTELAVLEKKAHQIRKENMKEFESILTREQKNILKQMKKEGRKKYHANHPRPVMQTQNLFKN